MSEQNVELVIGLQPAPDADICLLFRDDESFSSSMAAVSPFVAPRREDRSGGVGKFLTVRAFLSWQEALASAGLED